MGTTKTATLKKLAGIVAGGLLGSACLVASAQAQDTERLHQDWRAAIARMIAAKLAPGFTWGLMGGQ